MTISKTEFPPLELYLTYHPSPASPLRILVRVPTPDGQTERHTISLAKFDVVDDAITMAKEVRDAALVRLYPDPQKRPSGKNQRTQEALDLDLPDYVYLINYTGQNRTRRQRIVVSLPGNEAGPRTTKSFEIGRKWTIEGAVQQAEKLLESVSSVTA